MKRSTSPLVWGWYTEVLKGWEPPNGLKTLTHKQGTLVGDDLLEDTYSTEHLGQLAGDGLSPDVPEWDTLGVPGSIIHQD